MATKAETKKLLHARAKHYRAMGKTGLARLYDSDVAFNISELYEKHVHDEASAIEYTRGMIEFLLLSVFGMYQPSSTPPKEAWYKSQDLLRQVLHAEVDHIHKQVVEHAEGGNNGTPH
jgi:hypothetical protein